MTDDRDQRSGILSHHRLSINHCPSIIHPFLVASRFRPSTSARECLTSASDLWHLTLSLTGGLKRAIRTDRGGAFVVGSACGRRGRSPKPVKEEPDETSCICCGWPCSIDRNRARSGRGRRRTVVPEMRPVPFYRAGCRQQGRSRPQRSRWPQVGQRPRIQLQRREKEAGNN